MAYDSAFDLNIVFSGFAASLSRIHTLRGFRHPLRSDGHAGSIPLEAAVVSRLIRVDSPAISGLVR